MGLVQIDHVGLQAAQRILDGRIDVVRGQAGAFGPLGHLGRQHHLVALAAAGKPLADQRLRFAAGIARHPGRIHIGGVDQVEAGVDEGIEQGEAGLLIGAPAEHVATEGERTYMQAGTAQFAGCRHGHGLLGGSAPE
ncbi:hypothetical protein J3A72_000663 [Stenotrophomonas sp. PvP093]|nr:hypothetical protein [Stenotrophomonas sp. PvP093]